MKVLKNRRLQMATKVIEGAANKSTGDSMMSIIKLPVVRYAAFGVAAYNLLRQAVNSAASIVSANSRA